MVAARDLPFGRCSRLVSWMVRTRLKPAFAFAIAAWLAPALLSAQSTRRFEAASIKLNRSGAEASDTNTTPGRISVVNATVISVLRRAFGVQESQIVGAPAWLTSERFDIIAVTGSG